MGIKSSEILHNNKNTKENNLIEICILIHFEGIDWIMKFGERKGQLSQAEKVKQMTYRLEFGEYIKGLRNSQGLSTRAVGEELNISSNYISEIERGIKAPADHTIREFAELYGVEENLLFEKLKRVPLKATELLETQERLQGLLSSIQDSNLEIEEQNQLVEIMEATFEKYIYNKEHGRQQNFFGKFYPKV
ncbi:helix-turn-helix transcriptional regulator [Priestia endophytica]|uniref:helix-turn-helix domain-containing protein n=1 Tax=Priestia endophytica TaxID=135735 RepID=UPI003D2A949D